LQVAAAAAAAARRGAEKLRAADVVVSSPGTTRASPLLRTAQAQAPTVNVGRPWSLTALAEAAELLYKLVSSWHL